MFFEQYADDQLFNWVILPVLLFCARILDQSVGTLRLIFAAKGYKHIAPFLGFFESLIWLLAVSQVINQMSNWVSYVFYAGGFTAGSFVGMIIEEKISIGTVVVRIIPKHDTSELIKYLRAHDYGVTSIDVDGKDGPLKMLLTIVKRKEAPDVVKLVNLFNPRAFYTIEEVKAVRQGYFGSSRSKSTFSVLNPFRRKGK